MGPDGDAEFGAFIPAVVYGSTEYFVIWQGDDNSGSLVKDEFEIFGQRFASGFIVYLPVTFKESIK